MIFRGSRQVLNLYIFVIFQEEGGSSGPPVRHSGFAHDSDPRTETLSLRASLDWDGLFLLVNRKISIFRHFAMTFMFIRDYRKLVTIVGFFSFFLNWNYDLQYFIYSLQNTLI